MELSELDVVIEGLTTESDAAALEGRADVIEGLTTESDAAALERRADVSGRLADELNSPL